MKDLGKGGKIIPPVHPGDVGYDVFAIEDVTIYPNEVASLPLGLAIEFPDNFVCYVMDKSGIFKKTGLHCGGQVIDSSYRGQIHCQMANVSKWEAKIKKGEKLCQLVFHPVCVVDIDFVKELSPSQRGSGGFGSTGDK